MFITIFHEYLTPAIGLFLILCGVAIFIFPPKFGNKFYGVRTNWTLKNPTLWAEGQKLFAFSIMGIGSIFVIIGSFKIQDKVPNLAMILLLFALWTLSKAIVHKILSKKYAA
jgi:uncharacterized membrane protein